MIVKAPGHDDDADRTISKGSVYGTIGVALVGLAMLAFMGIVSNWLGNSMRNDFETGRRVRWVEQMKTGCPSIARRLDEFDADGRITDDEDGVIDTLFEQERAKPNGLATCHAS